MNELKLTKGSLGLWYTESGDTIENFAELVEALPSGTQIHMVAPSEPVSLEVEPPMPKRKKKVSLMEKLFGG